MSAAVIEHYRIYGADSKSQLVYATANCPLHDRDLGCYDLA